MVSMPLFMLLESGKSMMRYFAPNGTAGFATEEVNTPRRVPCPPARSIAIHSFLEILLIYFSSLYSGFKNITEFLGILTLIEYG